MKCYFCNEELGEEILKFCPMCGRKLPACPACGKVYEKKVRFCSNDGTPLPTELFEDDTHVEEPSKRTFRKVIGDILPWAILLSIFVGIVMYVSKTSGGFELESIFYKKVSLNENMDFGDFSLYFNEYVRNQDRYDFAVLGTSIASESDDTYLLGLSGVITMTDGDYLYIDDIVVKYYKKNKTTTYRPGVVTVKGNSIWESSFVDSLVKYDSAYIFYGTDDAKPDDEIQEMTITYTSSRGKKYSYRIIP